MKKILGIVVLGLLFSTSVFAEIVLNKCFQKPDKEFSSKKFRKYYVDINSSSKTIKVVYYYTQEGFTKITDKMKAKGYEVSYLKPMVVLKYGISLIDGDELIGLYTDEFRNEELILNIKNNTVEIRDLTTGSIRKIFCSPKKYDSQDSAGSKKVKSSGSGFFINNKGYFITNNHVIDGCSQSKITFKEKTINADLIATDQSLDLALLKVKVKPKNFLNLSSDPPEKLQKIYVAGYPFGKGLSDDLKFTQGIISSVKGFADNSNQIQIDAAINSGNSGGPIVNEDGDLIAVAVSGLDKSASEGIGFGIKANSVINFLEVNNVKYSTPGLLNFGMSSNKLNDLLEKSTVYTFCN